MEVEGRVATDVVSGGEILVVATTKVHVSNNGIMAVASGMVGSGGGVIFVQINTYTHIYKFNQN